MQEGPFSNAIEANRKKVIKQEFITYFENKDGNICKEVATRKFFDNDYVDSTTKDILSLIK